MSSAVRVLLSVFITTSSFACGDDDVSSEVDAAGPEDARIGAEDAARGDTGPMPPADASTGMDGEVTTDDAGGMDDAGAMDDTGVADAGADAGQSETGTVTPFNAGSTIGRQYHAMVELADGKVLVTGSLRTGRPLSARAESDVFDLAAGTVANVAPMQDGRHSHRLTLLTDGRVLVTGGYGGTVPAVWRTAELYDPATQMFTRVASEMSVARLGHAAFRLSMGTLAGQVLLVGGGPLGEPMTVELFDPDTMTFTPVTTTGAPMERQVPAVALLDDESVLITAGRVTSGGEPVAESYVYVPSTATFRRVGDAVVARHDPTATTLLDGRVLIVGGSTGSGSGGPVLATSEIYDPSTESFTEGPTMSEPRRGHTAARLGSGRVLVAGGVTGMMTLGSIELFVPASETFTPGADLSGARSLLESISLSDGRVFVHGGQHMTGLIFNTTEVISD